MSDKKHDRLRDYPKVFINGRFDVWQRGGAWQIVDAYSNVLATCDDNDTACLILRAMEFTACFDGFLDDQFDAGNYDPPA